MQWRKTQVHFKRDIGNMRIVETIQIHWFQFRRDISMEREFFCYYMKMPCLVTLNQTRDWEYRELLADRIAEAIVEQR